MADPRLTWRSVDAPTFGNVAMTQRNALDALNRAFSGLQNVTQSNRDNEIQQASNAAIQQALGLNTVADFRGAIGNFDTSNLSPNAMAVLANRENALISREAAAAAIGRTSALNQASGAAALAAAQGKDPTALLPAIVDAGGGAEQVAAAAQQGRTTQESVGSVVDSADSRTKAQETKTAVSAFDTAVQNNPHMSPSEVLLTMPSQGLSIGSQQALQSRAKDWEGVYSGTTLPQDALSPAQRSTNQDLAVSQQVTRDALNRGDQEFLSESIKAQQDPNKYMEDFNKAPQEFKERVNKLVGETGVSFPEAVAAARRASGTPGYWLPFISGDAQYDAAKKTANTWKNSTERKSIIEQRTQLEQLQTKIAEDSANLNRIRSLSSRNLTNAQLAANEKETARLEKEISDNIKEADRLSQRR